MRTWLQVQPLPIKDSRLISRNSVSTLSVRTTVPLYITRSLQKFTACLTQKMQLSAQGECIKEKRADDREMAVYQNQDARGPRRPAAQPMGSQPVGPQVMSAGGKALSFDYVLQKLQVSPRS